MFVAYGKRVFRHNSDDVSITIMFLNNIYWTFSYKNMKIIAHDLQYKIVHKLPQTGYDNYTNTLPNII